MGIVDKIKSLFQTQLPSDEELAARAEAESERERIRTEFDTERNPTVLDSARFLGWASVAE